MQPVVVKCPECGGKLEVAEAATVTKCNYCGAESRVQRRTQIFNRMKAMQAAMANEPKGIAMELPNPGAARKALIITLLVIGGIAFGIVMIVKKVKGSGSWTSNPPFVVDVNKDGVGDVIGLSRYLNDGDTMKLAAWNGKTGDKLWETGTLGNFDEMYSSLVTAAGGVVMHNDKLAGWYGYDAANGKRLWKVSPGENVDKVCAADTADRIVIHTADKKWKSVVVLTGAMTELKTEYDEWGDDDGKKQPCVPVPNNKSEDGWMREIREHGFQGQTVGMNVRRILAPADPKESHRLWVGSKYPGTGTPQLALFEGETMQWKIDVASTPMAAKESEPEAATMTETKVFAVYELKGSDEKPMIAAFERGSGKRLWEKQLPSSAWVTSGIAANETLVFVGTWTPLFAFDQATGDLKWTIGD